MQRRALERVADASNLTPLVTRASHARRSASARPNGDDDRFRLQPAACSPPFPPPLTLRPTTMSLCSMNRIALTRIAVVRSLHLSVSSVRLPRFATPPQRNRRRAEFSTTPRWNAAEDDSFNGIVDKQQKLQRVLEQHPQLKEHMKELFEALKAEGT